MLSCHIEISTFMSKLFHTSYTFASKTHYLKSYHLSNLCGKPNTAGFFTKHCTISV